MLGVRAVAAEPVHSLRLSASATSLAEAAAIPGGRPSARILDDVIRAIHAVAPGIDEDVDDRRARVLSWLLAPPPSASGGGTLVPSPLPPECWSAALGMAGASEEETSARLLADRRFSLVYYGLMRATPGLRAFLASRPELVAAMAREHAGVLAAFPRAVDVREGRAHLPGGAPLTSFWESLVGAPVADPAAFLLAVQSEANGRFAFLLDTVRRVDQARRAFALSEGIDARAGRLDDLRALAEVFVNTHREWNTAERPFWRLRIDPLVVLLNLDVDDKGRLAGPQSRRFWRSIVEGRELPAEDDEPPDDDGLVTAGWLLARVLSGGDLASQQRLGALTFTQRLLGRSVDQDAARLGDAGRFFMHVPALLLVLERIGVQSATTYVAVARAGVALGEGATTEDGQVALTTFQACIAIIDRAVARRSLSLSDASVLLEELSGTRGAAGATGRRALSEWVRSRLVPALQGATATARSPEDVVVDALAGVGSRHPDEPFQVFELDGEPYRVDLALPERERLRAIRRRQRSVNLGLALQLVGGAQVLAQARSGEEIDRAARDLSDALVRAASPESSRGGGREDESLLHEAHSALTQFQRERTPAPVSSAKQRVAREAVAAADWAVADALRGLAYAVSLGDARDVVTLAPDANRRHRLGVGRTAGSPLNAWMLPRQARDDGQVWHIRGALIGLESALPEVALRNLSATAEAPALFVYEMARRQLALTVALADPFKVTSAQRDQVMDAIARGSSAVRTLCDEDPAPVDEGVDDIAQTHVGWACEHDPSSVGELITLGRLVALGGADGPAPGLDALGTAGSASWSALGLHWTDRASRLSADGRLIDGLFVSAVIAPAVRAVVELTARGLPVALLPDVMALFMSDLIREAPLAYEGDAFGLALGAAQAPDRRFDAYVAALAAGGPIVPAALAGAETR